MAVVRESTGIPGNLVDPATGEVANLTDEFRLELGMVLAQAMLRRAEADLKWHLEQEHHIRAFLARRRVEQRRKDVMRAGEPEVVAPGVEAGPAAPRRGPRLKRVQPEPAAGTGDRVLTYLQLGVRNVRRA